MSFKLGLLGAALLAAFPGTGARSAEDSLFSALLNDHVRAGLVDYSGLASDERLDQVLATLAATDPHAIEDDQKRLAYWINAYNAFTLKLILEHMPVESIREIELDGRGPWDIPFIEIGGERYTLNRIEHEIIRREFSEPRIHMALVCAAMSCPPLRAEAYRGEDLEEQLEQNTQGFMADSTKNRYDGATGTLYLSEIFSWFGEDFHATHGSVQNFARRYFPVEGKRELLVRFLPYDWRLNRAAGGGAPSR